MMIRQSFFSLSAAALLLGACAPGSPQEVGVDGVRTLTSVTTGLSGRADRPIGEPGMELPLKPTRMAEFTTQTGTMMSLDVSPDGKTIVFDMLGDIYLIDRTGGKARPIRTGIAYDSQPVFSPDGTKIAFLSDYSGAENLWTMAVDGTSPIQLSYHDDFTIFSSPEWSPDGRFLTVSRFWEGENAYELQRFPADRASLGDTLRSTKSADGESSQSTLGAVFSPDGQEICFETLSGETPAFDHVSGWKIVCRNLKTEVETSLTFPGSKDGIPTVRPVLSPDGKYLAYVERRGGETRLMLQDRSSKDVQKLAILDPDSLQASLWHDAVPRYDFTPDGTAIVANLKGGFAEISLADGQITQLPFEADVKQPLGPLTRTQIPVATGPVKVRLIQWPAMSPGGSRLAFSALGRIYVADTSRDAELTTPLTPDDQNAHHPSWSADGQSLVYTSWTKKEGGRLWKVSLAEGKRTEITSQHAFYSHPILTPDGQHLIVVRSPAEDRNATYMEYGQLRSAQLIILSLSDGAERVLTSGRIGGKPVLSSDGLSVFINSDKGVERVSLEEGGGIQLVTQAVGAGWYFQPNSVPADDIRLSPDGKWAIAQIIQQLYLYPVESSGPVDLVRDPHVIPLTRTGADFAGWSEDGSELFWSIGATSFRADLSDILTLPDDVRAEDQIKPISVSVLRDRATPTGLTLLRGATVYPMGDRTETARKIENADILIDGAVIKAIGPRGRVEATGADIVDVTGRYIVPGFIDAHYHLADIRRDVLQRDVWGLRTGLAYGVTTLFDPSSLSIDMLAYQDMIEAGDIDGSRLFSTGPAIFSFNDFRTPAEVRQVLERYKSYYRLSNLKQYRVGNRRVRQWFVEEAGKLGMTPTTEGALSFKLGLSHIIDGYSGNEHALPPPVLHDDVAQLFAQSGTTSTLTLMITHGGTPADIVFYDRMTKAERARYEGYVPDYFPGMRFGSRQTAPAETYLYDEIAASANRIFEAGGIVGVGAHGDVPGLGTHWEMAAYVEGGWTPADAIWAGTMGSAIAIGRDASLGSLSEGKYADLVVLSEDPLVNIQNTTQIEFVIKNGQFYSPADLRSKSDK